MNHETDKKCKGCKRETHPAYLSRYDGYCLDCENTGVPERDERIAELESECDALKEALSAYQKFNRIGNDLDAYLGALADWALGIESEKPIVENFGVADYFKDGER